MLIKFKIIFLFFLSLLFSQEDGYDLYKNKNYDAAIQYYDNLINSNKKVPEANYGKGSTSYMQGDYDSALKSLDKALSTDESDLKNKIYYNIGNTYYKKKDSKKEDIRSCCNCASEAATSEAFASSALDDAA